MQLRHIGSQAKHALNLPIDQQAWAGMLRSACSAGVTKCALAARINLCRPVLVALLGLPDVAFAGTIIGVPGPVAGVGLLPVLAVAGGALWLVRRFSSRRQQ